MDQDPRSMSLGISQWIWQTPQSVSPRCQSCFQCETCQRAYCSFRSVNCFSSVVISSRHSILLLSQSSSSISVHIQTWQLWQPLHTTTAFYPHPHDNPTLHFTPKQPVSPFLREITRTGKHINYTRVCNTSLTVGWCSRPIFPTRAVSIFRHGRANGILLVCGAAVLLGKVHLHFFVVAFFLLPRVDRHCDCQISRC